MAGKADASIIFDTTLDPSGFDKGINNIGDSFGRMRETLSQVASASESAFSSKTQKNIDTLTQRLARQLEQLEKARLAVEQLKSEYDKLASGETQPKSIQNMSKELANVNTEIQKELTNNERLLQLYIDSEKAIESLTAGSRQYQMVGEEVVSSIEAARQMYQQFGTELDYSSQKLETLNNRASTLGDNISAVKLDPTLSQEAQSTATSLDQAAQKANRLAAEAQVTERNIKNVMDEEIPSRWRKVVEGATKTTASLAKGVRDVGKNTKIATTLLESMGKVLHRIKRMILLTFMFSVISKGLREVRSYIGSLMKTNAELIGSLNAVKVNLMTAFQPIFQAILPALNTLMSALARATAYMAQFISMLFGTTYEASRKAAEASYNQANALKEVGKQAKAASKSVQGFDQLNRQQSKDSGGGGAGGGGTPNPFQVVPMPELDPKWATMFKRMLDNILTTAEPTIASLKRLWEEGLKPLGSFTWQALKDFWNEFLVPMGRWTLQEGFPRFIDAITNQLAIVDWDRLNKALVDLWHALLPFSIIIGEGLLWFWEEVITPLIGWALNNLIPAAIDLITAAIEFLSEIIDAAMPALIWFWETFLVPIRDFAWSATIKFIELFTKALEKFTDWAKKNPRVIETIAKVLFTFLAGLWVYNTTKKLVAFLITLGERFVIFASQIGTLVVAHLPALAILALAAAFVIIGGMWSKLTPASKVATILGGLAAAAIAAAIAISVFHAAWSVGVAAAVIIGSIAAIGIAFASLKKTTGSKWSVSTPSINPFGDAGGGNADSFNSRLSGSPPLPRLAQGGLIPPRNPRAVIVGDNTQEDEIVSPRSAIREEVKNAIAELGGMGGINAGQADTLLLKILRAIEQGHTIEMDQRELGRTIVRSIRGIQNQTGQVQIQTKG